LVATLAFFTSARLGELLACREHSHDPTSDLTWDDVHFHDDSLVLIRLKAPKSGDPAGEFLDVFKFPGYNCCPVKCLSALYYKQKEAGLPLGATPVFRFRSGKNLTESNLNSILSKLLSHICVPGQDLISCHSFRSGVPTTLSTFPELADSEDIKGWGRWNSECYKRYTRLRLDQKEKIFSKIATALRSMAPM